MHKQTLPQTAGAVAAYSIPEAARLPKAAYSIPEAGYITSMGRSKLYELIAAGELRAIKAGARTLIPADAITEWLASLPAANERRDGALS